jgi:serine/threonine protein kinase
MRRCLTCHGRFDRRRLICPADSDILVDEGVPAAETGFVLNGRYRLGNLLGEGGMGRVFEATELETENVVAIKLLRQPVSALDQSGTAEKRLQVEAEAGLALDDPGVVKVHEFSQSPAGVSYIAMERLYGATFDELRRAGKFGTAERVVDLLRQVCEVLVKAHQKGIVHRDLKPSNLFLHRLDKDRSQVKVLDFGIAKFLDRGGERLTATGELLGTLLYMAPEQTLGLPITTASDVYSLGVVLFEALAGRVPFEGRSPMEILRVHALLVPPALSAFRPDISGELEAAVERCLLKRPERRFSDAGELARALSGIRVTRPLDNTSLEATQSLQSNPSFWVGLILDDRYEIQEWLSPGRFGSDVYRAVHLRTEANLAVRLWRTGKGVVRDHLLDAFRKEARTMQVRHPNLIAVLDLGFNDDSVYIVTELVGGVSLRTLLAKKGPLPAPVVTELIQGGAGALQALHENGIVSGGLSPDRIRVPEKKSPDGQSEPEKLMLSPLGLSSLKQIEVLFPRGGGASPGDRSLDYLSPEQRRGAGPDAPSDLYSLALICLEMLGGQISSEDVPPTKKASEDLASEEGQYRLFPAQPIRIPEGLSSAWKEFFTRAFGEDPRKRFGTAEEFLAALPGRSP